MAQFPTEIFAGLIMLVIAVAMVLGYRYYLRASADRRMRSMLEAIGIDPELVDNEDVDTTIAEMRDRCRHCNAEDVCERWLSGADGDGNDFCPNQELFGLLRRYSWYAR